MKDINSYFLKENHKNIIFIFAFSFFYVFPIIISQVYYIDDLGRILTGRDWSHDVRTAAGIIYKLFTFNKGIVNFYPYSSIIAAFIVSLILYISSIIIFNSNKLTALLASTLSICSPFFLENLTYRYDSLPMSLSLVIVLIPFFFIKNKFLFTFISIASTTLSLSFYQVGSLGFFSFLIIYIFTEINKHKKINLKEISFLIVISILSYIAGYILYKQIHHIAGYKFPNRGEIIFGLENINLYYERLITFKNSILNGLNIKITIIALIYPLILFSIKSIKSKQYILIGIIFYLFLIITLFIVSLPNLLIKEPWWNSRTKINFIFVLFFYFLSIGTLSNPIKQANLIFKSICILFLINSLFLVSAYGQSLKNHQKFSSYLSNSISNYILSKKYNSLVVIGRIPIAPQNKILHKEYPILNSISPRYERQGWYWGIRNFTPHRSLYWPKNRTEIEKNYCSYKIIYENIYMNLREYKDTLILDFQLNKC